MGSNNAEISTMEDDEAQASTFVIPPHIVAEAMSKLHGDNLDLRWSSPITPTERKYVEEYVQARYPEYTGGSIGEPGYKGVEHSGDGGLDKRSPRIGSPSFGLVTNELETIQLVEGHLLEILRKRVLQPDMSVSVPEIHARNRVLKQCGVTEEEYIVVFTNGTKDAMMLVGQGYPFQKYTAYMSALEEEEDGIKDYAVYKEAKYIQAPASWLDLRIAGSKLSQNFRRKSKLTVKGLFAFSLKKEGKRNSLHWISEAQRSLWHVLLDCTLLSLEEEKLNLTLHKPDFVLCTIPKVPQQPTKVTCLLVRKGAFLIERN